MVINCIRAIWSLTVLERFDLLQNLLPTCLTQFENNPLAELTLEVARQLHQVWLAHNGSFDLPAALTVKIQQLLQQGPKATSSRFHKNIVAALDWITWVKDTDVKQEYVVASYSVDIALIKLKVAIQVDGPTHYYPGTHDTTRITQLRNRLLTHAGWQVVVIPYFEWNNLHGLDNQIDYLEKKLAPAKALLPSLATPTESILTAATATIESSILSTEEVGQEVASAAHTRKRKKTKSERMRAQTNNERAEQIVKNAIHNVLGRWHTYGCASVPDDNQQEAISLIKEVFLDRKIQENEMVLLTRAVSNAIHPQSPWYSCFNKIYLIDFSEPNGLTEEKLMAIHDQAPGFEPALQA